MRAWLLPVATGATGLVAGLFVAFSVAVMPGLAKASDPVFVAAMQRMNVAILNPVFVLLLLGSPIALGLAVALGPERRWTAVALGLMVASMAITFSVNVPRNDALAAAGSTDPAAARAAFEHVWNLAHSIRTLLLVGSFVAGLVAMAQAARVTTT